VNQPNIIQLSNESFEEQVLKNSNPVVVDFWAQWCGPCRAFAPIFEETSNDYVGSVQFAKFDIDSDQAGLSAQFGIRSIPTIILFKNGQVAGIENRSLTKQELVKFIDSHI